MLDDVEISLATSHGNRECFSCGSFIHDRTVLIRGRKIKDEIALHIKCLQDLGLQIDEFSHDLGVGE